MPRTYDPVQARKESTRRLIGVDNRERGVVEIYACRRIETADLYAVDWPEIIGEDYFETLKAEWVDDEERKLAIANARDPEDLKRIEERLDARQRDATVRLLAHILADEERRNLMLRRCNAWVMASVEGVGIAKEGVLSGPIPAATAPRDICEVLPNGSYVVPVRIVPGEPGQGQICIEDLWADERLMLGICLQAIFSRLHRVRPLRRGQGPSDTDIRLDGRNGASAARNPDVDP